MKRFHARAAAVAILLLQSSPLLAAQPAAETNKPDHLAEIIKAVRAQE